MYAPVCQERVQRIPRRAKGLRWGAARLACNEASTNFDDARGEKEAGRCFRSSARPPGSVISEGRSNPRVSVDAVGLLSGGAGFARALRLGESARVGATASRSGSLSDSDLSLDPRLGESASDADFTGLSLLDVSALVGADSKATSRLGDSTLLGVDLAVASRLGDATDVFAYLVVRRSKQRCLQRR